MNYAIVDTDGQLVQVRSSPTSPSLKPGEQVIEIGDTSPREARNYWWDGVQLVAKAPFTATLSGATVTANGLDSVVLSVLPPGTKVEVRGAGSTERVPVDDGSFEFATELPGSYQLRATHPRRLPLDLTVEAV